MTSEKFTYLICVVWFVAVVLLIWAIMGIAKAADMKDCHAYANRGSAAALRQLLGMPFIDPSAGRFLYRKAYTYCLNTDEVPSLTFTPEEQPIIDMIPMLKPIPRPEPPAGSVPATGEDEQVGGNPPPVPSKPKKVSDPGPAGGDQPLCASHRMKTIYTNKHWRCRK